MTIWMSSHSVDHWHLPRGHLPGLRRPPPLHLSRSQVAGLRRGIIVALCAVLAGSLASHLRGSTRGPYAPAAATDRA